MRPFQEYLRTGERDIYSRGTVEQRPNFEGNKDTIWEQGTLKKKFDFFGNRGTSQFISREQGNRYPPPWAGVIYTEKPVR